MCLCVVVFIDFFCSFCPVLDVAAEMTDLSREELESLMDPQALTESDQSS